MSQNNEVKILVTGSSGFIGFHLSKRLLDEGFTVIGVDNFNSYYEVSLKESRNSILLAYPTFKCYKGGIEDIEFMSQIFASNEIDFVVNLAAQAGVRYSLTNPFAYISSNISGFVNVLENSKKYKVKHMVYASSSSVYGANTEMPFSEIHHTEHPISLYAATKKANEMIAHSYCHNFQLPLTGLRFFTVYGPWGRPDMAIFKFTRSIIANEPISVYNNGIMKRDFTYIDDIVEGIFRILFTPSAPNLDWKATSPDPSSSYVPYRIYNIGNNKPILLMDFIAAIEDAVGKKAIIKYEPLQSGDVLDTFADVSKLEKTTNFRPKWDIKSGVSEFVDWFRKFYKI